MDFKNSEIDDLKKALEEEVRIHKEKEIKFYIGCDSQHNRGKVKYVTAVSVIRDRDGGACFYRTEVEDKVDFVTRLWNETQKSVELATELRPFLTDLGYDIEEIHCDLNPSKKHKSSKVLNMCKGYVESMGFNCIVKPHSWAASKVADHRTRS